MVFLAALLPNPFLEWPTSSSAFLHRVREVVQKMDSRVDQGITYQVGASLLRHPPILPICIFWHPNHSAQTMWHHSILICELFHKKSEGVWVFFSQLTGAWSWKLHFFHILIILSIEIGCKSNLQYLCIWKQSHQDTVCDRYKFHAWGGLWQS